MTNAQAAAHAFTPETSYAAMVEACAAVGLDSDGAELLRLGENAIYLIRRSCVVVRIARGLDVLADARKEVAVSRWLRAAGLSAARVADFEQPIVADGRPVTFWRFIESTGEEASVHDLGTALRKLHSLEPPQELELPSFDMFDRVDTRIDRANDIPEDDRRFLRERVSELRSEYAALSFELQPCAVHGDAHTANLIRTPDGPPVLIDFERFAFGQPEIDLAVTAVEHHIGWYTSSDYARFVRAYGYDVTEWSGFRVLQAISELKMTTWIMQNAGHSAAIASETRERLDSLRSAASPRRWKPF